MIARPGLLNLIAGILHATGLEPRCLTLEVTESVMLRDADPVASVLQALAALGVRLVLDDFGTGYSSLAYLTSLPLEALKVDRSFVDGLGIDPRDTAITEAIIAMAHALSLDVVAEGVETQVQLSELTRLGCDSVQGYYFSPPISAEQIGPLLRTRLGSAAATRTD